MIQGFVPSGEEFQLNTFMTNGQSISDATGLENGGFVAVWQSAGGDGSGSAIFSRVFDASGNGVGSDFRLSTTTLGSQGSPVVTGLSDGSFVAVWTSQGQGTVARRFAADGTMSGEFLVNPSSPNGGFPSVTTLSDGGFAVARVVRDIDGDGWGVFVQRFDSASLPIGSEIQVSTDTVDNLRVPDIKGLSGGGFVVTWQALDPAASTLDIHAQVFDAAGQPVGAEFSVNTLTDHAQWEPEIATLSDGGFVIAWQSLTQDGDSWGIFAQRFDAGGNPVDGEFQVNSFTTSVQDWPSIVGLPDGGFVVVWTSRDQVGPGDVDIYGQRYDHDGAPVGGEVLINTTTAFGQSRPSIAVLENGGFVVTWDGNPTTSIPGVFSYGDVFAQIFGPEVVGTDADETFTLGDGTDQIFAMGGNDTVIAPTGGDDVLHGGDGIDLLSFEGDTEGVIVNLATGSATGDGIGSNVIANFENITGGDAGDALTGDAGDNVLDGGAGDDLIVGGAGADTLIGGDGIDTASYENSAAAVTVNLTDGTASGGDAEGDSLSSIENLTGSAFDDILRGDNKSNEIFGGDGADNIRGMRGSDVIDGGDGDDSIGGDQGHDVIDGGEGNDRLWGNGGNDVVRGGDGNDAIGGGWGNDQLFGGAGNDKLRGHSGQDLYNGGTGNDLLIAGSHHEEIFVFVTGDGVDTIRGFGDGVDLIRFDDTEIGFDDLVITDNGSGDAVVQYGADDEITIDGMAGLIDEDDFVFSLV